MSFLLYPASGRIYMIFCDKLVAKRIGAMKKKYILIVMLTIGVLVTVKNKVDCRAKHITILVYHHIVDGVYDTDNCAIVSIEQFSNDMLYIKRMGFEAISFEQLIQYQNGASLPRKPIIITFDDGYLSNYELAFPVLKEMGIKATICIVGSTVGIKEGITPHFDWQQANEMVESGLISIQSHTYDLHSIDCCGVGTIDGESIEQYKRRLSDDFRKINSDIETNLGYKPFVLAYPNCVWNDYSEQVAKEAGYIVTLAEQGHVAEISDNLFLLDRYAITKSTDVENYLY